MRTGRALTVSEGGVGASQKKFFWGKEIEKKRNKNLETPRKLETPLKNWRPQKIGDTPKIGDPRDKTPPQPVDRHMLVKILPWPNFVAAGNYAL